MPKVKLPRKSTTIDMTAMCDVAFLLLSFFILTAKFKPSDALAVVTPSSVQTKTAAETNVVLITIDKDNKVYFSVSEANKPQKKDIIDDINTTKALGLTDAEKANFSNKPSSYIGVPFSRLKSFLQHSPDEIKPDQVTGIPVDSTNNELVTWIASAKKAFSGTKMYLIVKGDNASKYPAFQGVKNAFIKNDEMKFQVVTNPAAVPPGTELFKANMQRKG
ncbi:MAG TPA: biopolymer transporter ExbD [Puia sp.]|nr:biopolymer transporter ExbD [Puia sp.]